MNRNRIIILFSIVILITIGAILLLLSRNRENYIVYYLLTSSSTELTGEEYSKVEPVDCEYRLDNCYLKEVRSSQEYGSLNKEEKLRKSLDMMLQYQSDVNFNELQDRHDAGEPIEITSSALTAYCYKCDPTTLTYTLNFTNNIVVIDFSRKPHNLCVDHNRTGNPQLQLEKVFEYYYPELELKVLIKGSDSDVAFCCNCGG